MRSFNPLTLVLVLFAILFFAGGNYYNAGVYRPYGIGIGSILVVIFICFLFGVF